MRDNTTCRSERSADVAAEPVDEDQGDGPLSQPDKRVRRQPADVNRIADMQDVVRQTDYRKLAARLWEDCRGGGLKSALLVGVAEQFDSAEFSASLAIALAELQEGSVLLLDGDIQQRRLTHALQQAATPGWTRVLGRTGEAVPPAVPTENARLEFMPAGHSEAPVGADSSGAIANAIAELTDRCDLLLVDCGPLSNPATELLARACDATYPVLRLGRTQVDEATAILRRIQNAGGRIPGCFATDAARVEAG
jgi:Mrp family chromosome partitioning ATPase